jgi:hypothetical protein
MKAAVYRGAPLPAASLDFGSDYYLTSSYAQL